MGIFNLFTLQILSAFFSPFKSVDAMLRSRSSLNSHNDQFDDMKRMPLQVRSASNSAQNFSQPLCAPTSALPRHKLDMIKANSARHGSTTPRIKVIREFREFGDAGSRSIHGRLIISGRMSDVCAELDRMT